MVLDRTLVFQVKGNDLTFSCMRTLAQIRIREGFSLHLHCDFARPGYYRKVTLLYIKVVVTN